MYRNNPLPALKRALRQQNQESVLLLKLKFSNETQLLYVHGIFVILIFFDYCVNFKNMLTFENIYMSVCYLENTF